MGPVLDHLRVLIMGTHLTLMHIHPMPKPYLQLYREPITGHGTHLKGNSVHGPTTYLRDLTMGTLFIHPTPKTCTYRDPLTGTHITGNSVHGPVLAHLRVLIKWGPILL